MRTLQELRQPRWINVLAHKERTQSVPTIQHAHEASDLWKPHCGAENKHIPETIGFGGMPVFDESDVSVSFRDTRSGCIASNYI
jgi:hypothetical protein